MDVFRILNKLKRHDWRGKASQQTISPSGIWETEEDFSSEDFLGGYIVKPK